MALNLRWTKRASDKLHSITNFTDKEFGIPITQQVVRRIFHVLDIIAEYPEIGSLENKKKSIRGFTITRHNKIFYRVNKKNEVIILNIFDNRSNNKKY